MARMVSSKMMLPAAANFLGGQITGTAAGFTALIGRFYSEIDALLKAPPSFDAPIEAGHASEDTTLTGLAGGEEV